MRYKEFIRKITRQHVSCRSHEYNETVYMGRKSKKLRENNCYTAGQREGCVCGSRLTGSGYCFHFFFFFLCRFIFSPSFFFFPSSRGKEAKKKKKRKSSCSSLSTLTTSTDIIRKRRAPKYVDRRVGRAKNSGVSSILHALFLQQAVSHATNSQQLLSNGPLGNTQKVI